MGGVGVDWEDLICLGLISSGWGVILYICVRCRGQGAGGASWGHAAMCSVLQGQ